MRKKEEKNMKNTNNKKINVSIVKRMVAIVMILACFIETINICSLNSNAASKSKIPAPVAEVIPLKSLKIEQKSYETYVGGYIYIYVKKSPVNANTNCDVTWLSSNNKIATVKNGRVIGKKVGTVTITAKAGKKKATCKVKVTQNGKYIDVSEAYKLVNNFRTNKKNQWFWNPDNRTKFYPGNMKPFIKDATLERIAKDRAKEQWTQYFVYGKFTHDRIDGSVCWTAYTGYDHPAGECLGFGHRTCKEIVNAWAETNAYFSGQGHRRIVLDRGAVKYGIACYEKDGKKCWALCTGY